MRNENLNLNGIAMAIANETNGFISRDLYEALKAIEGNYNYSDANKLSGDIKVEDRVLNYGQDGKVIDKEADIILQVRAKNGDHTAVEMLYIANKGCLQHFAHNKAGYCGRSFDARLSIVNLTYLEFINKSSIYYNGKVYKSASNSIFEMKIGTVERIDRSEITPIQASPKFIYVCELVKQKIRIANIEIITKDVVKKYMPSSIYTCKSTIETVYDILTRRVYSIDDRMVDSEDETKSNKSRNDHELLKCGVIDVNPTEDKAISNMEPSLVMEAVKRFKDELFMKVFIDVCLNDCSYSDIEDKYGIYGKNRIDPLIRKAKSKIAECMYQLDSEEASVIAKERIRTLPAKPDKDTLVELHKTKSCVEIGKQYGVTRKTVNNWFYDYNLAYMLKTGRPNNRIIKTV